MSKIEEYPQGTFNWTDLSTTDPAGAKNFYTGLFEWTFEDVPVDDTGTVYSIAKTGEHEVAGLYGQREEQEGMPPVWHSYVAVDDADVCAQRAAELGGMVYGEPFDVMEAGRMAVVQDPTGAVFQPWQGNQHKGSGIANEPVSLCWNELLTRDPAAAESFYCQLFGWTAEQMDMGTGPYTMLRNGERAAGGIFKIGDEMENVPPHWAVYFAVADVDATVERALRLGGNLHMEPVDIPEVGRFALLVDPHAGFFNVINLLNPD